MLELLLDKTELLIDFIPQQRPEDGDVVIARAVTAHAVEARVRVLGNQALESVLSVAARRGASATSVGART